MGLFDNPVVNHLSDTVSNAAVKTAAQANGVAAKTASEIQGAITSTKTQLDDLTGGRSYTELATIGANRLIDTTVSAISGRVDSAIQNVGNRIQSSVRSIANTISGILGRLKNFLFGGSSNNLVNIDGSIMGLSSSYQSVRTILNNSGFTETKEGYGIFYLHTNSSYPTRNGGSFQFPKYNWEINPKTGGLYDMFRRIQYNLDIPSYYSKSKVNEFLHVNFNRYRKEFPDMYLKNTMSVIIFTRPDLNLFDGGSVNSLVAGDPRSNVIIANHKTLAKLLTADGNNQSHKFNPLLSNLAQNLEINDDSVDVLETAETYTGYKTQYSKHNIKSITSGTFSIKYKETSELSVTNMHQLWVDYQSNVYRGIFEPKREYIYNKELDYACDVYYFLLDQDGETIKFWSKYYGVFPHNVPKSAFSFDFGSPVSFPELSINYSYIYKEDLSPVALMEFNENAGVSRSGFASHVKNYETSFGHSGKTWVGTPFIYSYNYNGGLQTCQGFKLGWMPSSNDAFSSFSQY